MQNVPRRLRVIGASVLVIGALAAGLVYWLGSRNGDMSDDLSMQGFSRAEQRQMGQLYGKSGLLIDQLEDDLKQPGTRAIIILEAAVSPTSSRQIVGKTEVVWHGRALRVGNPRYSRLEVCATTQAEPDYEICGLAN